MAPSVQVRGLIELRSALRAVETEAPKELQRGLKAIAETVAVQVRARVPHRTGRAASSITARASQSGAAIAIGGQRAPYYPWLDFGGSVGKGHRPGKPNSGSVKRPMLPGGRYLYPAIKATHDSSLAQLNALMDDLSRRYDFDTEGG